MRRGWGAIILTGALGALAAAGFALALDGAGAFIADATDLHEPDLAAKYALLALLVVISAAAGALRYLMERLNVEAEALNTATPAIASNAPSGSLPAAPIRRPEPRPTRMRPGAWSTSSA